MSLNLTMTDVDAVAQKLRDLEWVREGLLESEQGYLHDIREVTADECTLMPENIEKMKAEYLTSCHSFLAHIRSRIEKIDAEIAKLKFGTPGV